VEDEYMFGEDVLVAPLMEEARSRKVYLPPGSWVDYQGGQCYDGGKWHTLTAGEIPVIMLVRDGAAIPHVELAQSTDRIDFSELELVVYGAELPTAEARALVCFPEDGELHRLRLKGESDAFVVEGDPLPERAAIRVVHFA
jgi:alpha-D-xyloside xylohydrolase